MSPNRASSRKQKKRKERERRIARERNLRRNAAPPPIEDMRAEEGDEVGIRPRYDSERVLRYLDSLTRDRTFESLEELERATAETAGCDIGELVAEMGRDRPVERAQELAFQAMETPSREDAGRLARAALELDPDCADALSVLAGQESRIANRIAGLERAVSAAERFLGGPSYLAEHAGHFWGLVMTRPYVRARQRLAQALCAAGDLAGAALHYRALLDLNHREDHLGIRHPLVPILLERGDPAGARELLDRFPGERSPMFAWARVLERFLAGDRAGASCALRVARKANPRIEGGLHGDLAAYDEGIDPEDETFHEVDLLLPAWRAHPEALCWLELGGPATTAKERREALPSYSHPVASLLSKGEAAHGIAWREEAPGVFGAEHVPELVRMATEPALHECDQESTAVWAPVHAWRELAHLRASEAARPLARLVRERFDDDWVIDDMKWVFAEIGPLSLPSVSELLADREAEDDARFVAAEAMCKIAEEHPEYRAEVVTKLIEALDRWKENPPHVNGSIVGVLVTLRARQAGPLIRAAYEAGGVDEDWGGSWEYVRVDLDLDEDGEPQGP